MRLEIVLEPAGFGRIEETEDAAFVLAEAAAGKGTDQRSGNRMQRPTSRKARCQIVRAARPAAADGTGNRLDDVGGDKRPVDGC